MAIQPATQAWWFAAGRLLATVLIGCGAGWLFGNTWGGLAVALALHLAWVLVNLFRLEWWLRHRSYADPPESGGVWGEIIAQIVRLHRRKRFHKQRFVQLMRQLQRSTAALPDGVVILNAQREIVWFNLMAARLLNLRRTADLGMRIENLLREPEVVRYLGGTDYSNPIVIRPATADDSYLSLQVAPYGDGQLLLLVRDVSRQMRLEAVRRDFVANASHELRSPLTRLRMALELLRDEQGPASERRVKEAVAEIEELDDLVEDILIASRIEAGAAAGPLEDVDLGTLLASEAARVGAVVETAPPLTVRSEPRMLKRMLRNLLENAARHGAGQAVVCGLAPLDGPEGGARIFVSDRGPGVPASECERIFERFYRAPAGSASAAGVGLGLALVREIAEHHGGSASCRPREGGGATFEVVLRRLAHPATSA